MLVRSVLKVAPENLLACLSLSYGVEKSETHKQELIGIRAMPSISPLTWVLTFLSFDTDKRFSSSSIEWPGSHLLIVGSLTQMDRQVNLVEVLLPI